MADVLIIDDSKQIHRMIRSALAAETIDVHSAYSGGEGIAAARRTRPDLIVLDLNMPGIDGLETCRRLVSGGGTDRIPVVFLSGSASVPEKILGLNAGAVDYIAKPVDLGELRARIKSALRRGEMECMKRFYGNNDVQPAWQFNGLH